MAKALHQLEYDTRTSPRRPAKVDVFIYRNSLPVAVGRIREVSASGAYIATNPERFRLTASQGPIELELSLGDRESRRAYRLYAEITRRGIDGIGVRFTDSRPSRVVERLLAEVERNDPFAHGMQ